MSKTRFVLTAAVALGMIALAGCSSDDEQPAIKQQSSNEERKKSQELSRSKKVSADDLKKAVLEADLGSADVGYGLSRQSHDDEMETPTNDICGRDWPSDVNRIERIQDSFWEGDQASGLIVSNEVVAYKPGTGADVLAELEKAVAGCNQWKHDDGEISAISLSEPPSGALGASFAWTATDTRGGFDYNFSAVYQTKGDLMSVVYVWARDRNEMNEVSADVIPKAAQLLDGAI